MSKRSYVDTLNAGRQRKGNNTLDQITQSLSNLESRLDRTREALDETLRDRESRNRPQQQQPRQQAPYAPPKERAPARNRRQDSGSSSYQSLARDFDRVRDQEEGIESASRIAAELKGMRDEMRHQMTSNMTHEFETMRRDLGRMLSSSKSSAISAELASEMDRIAGAIHNLSERTDDRSINALRHEIEQVKGALGSLAREDTVRSSNRRLDEFDRRWTALEDRVDARDPEISMLADRLQSIGDAVNNLPESLSMRSIEEKVRVLSGALDQFVLQQERQAPETFRLIEERLDEISRAIVASATNAPSPVMDPEPLHRIEARISALARQIDEIVEDRPSVEVIGHITNLTRRVDELAARGAAPQEAIERLSRQVLTIANRIENNPSSAEREAILNDIGQRFDVLSRTLERRQGDVIEKSGLLFRDLEARLDDVARKLEHQSVGAFENHLHSLMRRVDDLAAKGKMPDQAIEQLSHQVLALAEQINQTPGTHERDAILKDVNQRFDLLSDMIERRQGDAFEHGKIMFHELEKRLEAVTTRLEKNSGEPATEDMHNLMRRVDDLAAQSGAPRKAIENLSSQVKMIADRIDQAPSTLEREAILKDVNQRFDLLSSMIERRQGDAVEHSTLMFRDLESRLEDMATRLQSRPAEGLDASQFMNAIDARFAEFADQFAYPGGNVDHGAIRQLEDRLENISARIDASASKFAGMDSGLLRSLEEQVAALSDHLARPSAPLPELEDIAPRLNELERAVLGSREAVVEAARQAAENAVRFHAGSQMDDMAVAGLTQDLKALEDLTRRSDERNNKTFEAIHDTLIKIVDRLGTLDAAPAAQPAPVRENGNGGRGQVAAPRMDETSHYTSDSRHADTSYDAGPTYDAGPAYNPGAAYDAGASRHSAPAFDPQPYEAQPRQEAPRFSEPEDPDAQATRRPSEWRKRMQASGNRSFADALGDVDAGHDDPGSKSLLGGVSRGQNDPYADQHPNQPLEPGSGGPDLNAIMKRVREERNQTVAGDAGETASADFLASVRRRATGAGASSAGSAPQDDNGKGGGNSKISGVMSKYRKPTLLSATILAVGLLGFTLFKSFTGESGTVSVAQNTPAATHAATSDVTDGVSSGDVVAAFDHATGGSANGAPTMEAAARQADPAEPLAVGQLATVTMPYGVDGSEVTAAIPNQALPEITPASEAAAPAAVVDVPREVTPDALREAASTGDAKALFEIANRYSEGKDIKQNLAEAAKWYEKSADLGFAPAQYRIGNMFEKATGVERDIGKAKTWYQLSAQQGNASAMHNLAVLYAMGADGATDNESAARWFKSAAELGVKDSQFNLGIFAAKGIGMTQSLEESYRWFSLAAKSGDRDAAKKRDEVAGALRPEQLEKARADVAAWKPAPINPETNSVEIPESWQVGGVVADADKKKAIGNIQRILKKNGYEPGGTDGVMGDKTKKAIMAFQRDNNMEPTGEVSMPLVQALLAKK